MSIQSVVYRIIPPFFRKRIKQTYYAGRRFFTERIIEPTEVVVGLRDKLTPPRSKIFVGDGDFKAIGETFRQYFIDFCQLQPDHAVLDVGCGIGRMAVPLTSYLSANGSYEGFDPVADGIHWCQQHITPRFPNFQFRQVNLFNGFYNPAGQDQAITYRFPYNDDQFDTVVVVGVFTHMTINEISTYLGEIKRVLKPGGRCLTSFFLLDNESRRLMVEPGSAFNFQYPFEGCWAFDPHNPNTGSAHDEAELLRVMATHGLPIQRPIRYGSWSSRQPATSFLDIIILEKP